MTKTLSIAALCAVLAACNVTPKSGEAVVETLDDLSAFEEQVYSDTTLTDTVKDSLFAAACEDLYARHPDDSTGLQLFRMLITNFWEPSVSLERYGSASGLIRGNQSVATKIAAIENMDSVAPGRNFIDICGPDALGGGQLSISGILAAGKPVLVDFWASWCPPCRREIRENLTVLASEGKVNILGIAVWEESVEDTRKAMEELSVTWPVIYSGGRENSPTVTYGVLGIPTLFLISPEGVILASGHSVDEFMEALP